MILLLPRVFYWTNKKCTRMMKYEGECIKIMKWVKLYKNYNKLVWENSSTFLILMMFDWTNKTMKDSYEVWRWVHLKYGTGWIVQILNSIKTKNSSYLAVTNKAWLNLQNNDWMWFSITVSESKIWNE